MRDLIQFQWQAFDLLAGVKISLGLAVMLALTHVTGEPWLATALAAMLAWLANVPGPPRIRVAGMLAFAAGSIAVTLVSGLIGLALWPNIVAIAVVGLFGTLALARGTRAYMVGIGVISWAIYGPFLVESTSVLNCVLAIVAGTGVVILLNIIGEWASSSAATDDGAAAESPEQSSGGLGLDYVIAYAITVALVLSFTTYFGWVELKTDPTLMVGGAFYIIGFEANKTWVTGIARVLGLTAGVLLGLWIANILGPGVLLDLVAIIACGMSFAAVGIHPGGWMFFFMVFIAIGWSGLESDAFDATVRERFYGESMGVLTAMAAIAFLHWWQTRRQSSDVS